MIQRHANLKYAQVTCPNIGCKYYIYCLNKAGRLEGWIINVNGEDALQPLKDQVKSFILPM